MKKLGRYDVIRVMGSGAMGWVYECQDPNLNRRVAIKTIKVENLSQHAASEYESRFKTEAHSAARLQHPHIVSVYDSDRDAGVAFLVMEFIEGHDLKHHLDAGRLYSLRETMDIMAALLSALDYAHRQHIVHRDVKPANLLIDQNGVVKLTDFGVARIQDSGEVTRTQGSVVGTLKYMSPEQIQSLPVDARTDLFAVGVVLYQLLTGIRPFEADTDFGVIQKIVSHFPNAVSTLNPQLPLGLDAVVNRALAKARDDRFSSAREFSEALLEACQNAEAWQAKPTSMLTGSQPSFNASTTTGREVSPATESTLSVTQEIELVYWKEIRDSTDAEDLNVFLSQFPKGIYAALAQRRLKQLGFTAVEHSQVTTVLQANANRPAASASLYSVPKITMVAVSMPTLDSDSENLETRESGGGERSDLHHARTSPPRRSAAENRGLVTSQSPVLRWGLGFFGVLAAVVSAWFMFQGRVNNDVLTSTADAELLPSPLRANKSEVRDATVVTTTSSDKPSAFKPSSESNAKAAPPVWAQASAAEKSTPSSKSRKSAPDESQLTQATNSPTPPNTHSSTVGASRTTSNNPRQMCADRILLGFQMCMAEQCEKAAFSKHAACVERRRMEQQRLEQELIR